MPENRIKLKAAQEKGEMRLLDEVGKSRITEAVRAHLAQDLGVADLNAITFGLGFSLDIDW